MSKSTVSIELSKSELSDIRIALMDYRSKWFENYMEELNGKSGKWKEAGEMYDTVVKLQSRIRSISDELYLAN
jgi:hypothetical protein